jgi:hypothetical protein
MFIREWRGRAKQADAARYPEYFRNEVSRQLRQAPGFQGGYSSRREVPAAMATLVAYDHSVRHYEVLENL